MRRKKRKPKNTKESPHAKYFIPKGTTVLLTESDETIEEGIEKEHITTKDLSFTDAEFKEYKDGWYLFEKGGWFVTVQRKFVASKDIMTLF